MKPLKTACDMFLVSIVAMLLMHMASPGTVEVPVPTPVPAAAPANAGSGTVEEPPVDFPFA